MLIELEVTVRETDLIERALVAYGRDKSEIIRAEITTLLRSIREQKR